MKRFISVFLAIIFIISQNTFVFADKNTSNNIDISSKSAVLMDVYSGQVLYEKKMPREIASSQRH